MEKPRISHGSVGGRQKICSGQECRKTAVSPQTRGRGCAPSGRSCKLSQKSACPRLCDKRNKCCVRKLCRRTRRDLDTGESEISLKKGESEISLALLSSATSYVKQEKSMTKWGEQGLGVPILSSMNVSLMLVMHDPTCFLLKSRAPDTMFVSTWETTGRFSHNDHTSCWDMQLPSNENLIISAKGLREGCEIGSKSDLVKL